MHKIWYTGSVIIRSEAKGLPVSAEGVCRNMNTIITIGRQYGSGGREIGKRLAEEYGIKFYDKELLAEAAKKSGICEELFARHDERPTNSFLYSLVMDTYSMNYTANGMLDMPLDHKVFLAQFDAIKELADTEPCVIVGRCADYALSEYPNVINIFIRADLENRIARVMERHDLNHNKAKELISKTDKKRANYYNYYSNKKWGDSSSYHLTIDSGLVGVDGAIEVIKKMIEVRENM